MENKIKTVIIAELPSPEHSKVYQMPFITAFIHIVWTTKKRHQFLDSPTKRIDVWNFIRKYGRENGIHVDFVGGYDDHCHCILSLNSTQSIDHLVGMLKGASARFINAHGISVPGFSWQKGYYASAICFDQLNSLRNYIKNQENHHSNENFDAEYQRLLVHSGHTSLLEDFE